MADRILHILGGMNRGGAQTFIMNVCRYADPAKWRFDFLLNMENPEHGPEIESRGGRIFHIPPRRKLGLAGYAKEMDAFFREHAGDYAAVHQHASSLSSLTPLKYATKYGVPIRILHAHNTSQSGSLHKVLHFLHKPLVTKYANRFLACSDTAGRWLFGGTPAGRNFRIVRNGIDCREFAFDSAKRESVRNELKLADKTAFGHVGRFEWMKNHNFILQVFENYQRLVPDSRLILVGEGVLEAGMKELAGKLGIGEKVLFLGSQSCVADILQAVDVFLFPSVYEGLPYALVEAQASGLDIYCSDRVTPDVGLTPCLGFYPLEKTAGEWAAYIYEKHRDFVREDRHREVAGAGYDVQDTVNYLEKYVYATNDSR